jgi:hypothetical protein
MIRGTTPTHTFTTPLDVEIISDLRLSYAQEGVEIFNKKKSEVTLDGKTISVRLTQEETLKFDTAKGVAQIQLKVLTEGGDVFSSDVMNVNVWDSINNEVLKV